MYNLQEFHYRFIMFFTISYAANVSAYNSTDYNMEENKDYQVITETNKKSKHKKVRLIKRIFIDILCGMVFGLSGAAALGIVYPGILEIIEDRYSIQSNQPDGETRRTVSGNAQDDEEYDVNDLIADGQDGDQNAGDPGASSAQIVIREEQTLTVNQYQVLYNKLIKVGTNANTSLVTVSVKSSRNADLFDTNAVDIESTDGIIIDIDDEFISVLTESSVVGWKKRGQMTVTLPGGAEFPVSTINSNEVYGIAVLKIAIEDETKEFLDGLTPAVLSETGSTYTGRFVIAVGSPRGIKGEILCGAVSTTKGGISVMDGELNVIVTDMQDGGDSGFIMSAAGEVVGMILPSITSAVSDDVMCAVSMSDLYPVIQLLKNNDRISVVGLYLSEVTEQIAAEYDVPVGAYVRRVDVDSPALSAGVWPGDIVCAVNGTEISTVAEYKNLLYESAGKAKLTLSVLRNNGVKYERIELTVDL